MIKVALIFLQVSALFFVSKNVSSQDSIACYLTKNKVVTEIKDSATYFRVGVKKEARWHGRIKDYYMSGAIEMDAEYTDGLENGMATFFYQNGNVKSKGYHIKGKRENIWNFYHENTNLYKAGKFKDDKMIGDWKYYFFTGKMHKTVTYEGKEFFEFGKTNEVYDSTGKSLVKNGKGECFLIDYESSVIEKGCFVKGLKVGVWQAYSKTNELIYKEQYEKGELVEGESYHNNIKYVYKELQTTAEFPGGMSELKKFLESNIHYPQSCRDKNIQGKVYVEFVISTTGEVIKVKIKRSVQADIDMEAVRVIKLMPDWKPATNRGKPVRIRYVLPVNFKLD